MALTRDDRGRRRAVVPNGSTSRWRIVRSGHARDPEGIRFMAGIEKRPGKDGRTATWRVKWREGGTRDGAQPTPWGWIVAATPAGTFLIAVSMLERRVSLPNRLDLTSPPDQLSVDSRAVGIRPAGHADRPDPVRSLPDYAPHVGVRRSAGWRFPAGRGGGRWGRVCGSRFGWGG